jgi:hypothetical protein
MRIEQPDDSKGFSFSWGRRRGWGGQILSNQMATVSFKSLWLVMQQLNSLDKFPEN